METEKLLKFVKLVSTIDFKTLVTKKEMEAFANEIASVLSSKPSQEELIRLSEELDTKLKELASTIKEQPTIDEIVALIPTPKDGKDGKDGVNGRNGLDGRDGIDGKDGLNGKDGSPDTGEQIVEKINSQETQIDASKIKNLPKATETIVREMTLGQVETPLKAGTGIAITRDSTGAKVISASGSSDIILTSPDNTRWQLSIGNDGVLITTSL